MGVKISHRDVGPIIYIMRALIRGRKFIPHLRFADDLAARTQPQPRLPGGPHHKTSKVYYHTRDARRLVEPPIVISTSKQIAAGSGVSADVKPATPNAVYNPELIPPPEPIYPDQVGESIFQK